MTAAVSDRRSYRDGNSTADRALTILQMFDEGRPRISASEVADHLTVSRSTAYRYLQTLVRSEFLAEEPGIGFRLGAKVMELARLARRGYGLSEMAQPIMRHLAAQFHETVLLTKRIGATIVCLEREEWPGQYVRLSYERGSRLSLNAGASAWVLLAWLTDDEVRDLVASEALQTYTSASLTNPDDILKRLDRIRTDGYSVARGELDRDAIGIAAPIFSGDGQVCGGLSIVTLQSRLASETVPEVVQAVVDSAQHLSREMTTYSD